MAKIKKIPVWLLLTFIPYLVAIGMILNFGIFGASFMGTTIETILIVVETPDGERFASETYFGTYLHLSPNCFEE